MKKYRIAATWAMVFLLSFSVGFISDVSDNYFEISKNLDIFGKLYREINSLYVDDTDPTKLMRTGIDAMLGSLDPYTNYISEKEVDDFRFMSTGHYGGIGALIGKRNNRMIVIEPYEGYPADKSGLKTGDQLLKVGNEAIAGTDKEVIDVRNLLRGERGTPIELTIKRGEKELSFTLNRDRIKIDNVPYFGMIDDKVGYISLTGFTQDAGKEVQKATEALKKENPALAGIVLDLRNNPGGRLDEAVNVSNVFVPQKEVIVETRGRIDGSKKSHVAKRSPIDTEIPLAVIVNQRSASASEIVAGSLQDLDRAIIIGQRSFGKGLVQNIRPLSYNTQLKVTTAKYYTPSGRCIQAINYAERNEDGSVARIPDSLKNAFTTRNGRIVYDGGGIEPDIKVEKGQQELIVRELVRQGILFEFALEYLNQQEQIAEPREFDINDATYQGFVAFARKQDFSYKTPSDRQLEKLTKTIDQEEYTQVLKSSLENLEGELNKLKNNDLLTYKADIIPLLRDEILKQRYYRKGALEGALAHDEEVKKAVEVLSDQEKYKSFLSNQK